MKNNRNDEQKSVKVPETITFRPNGGAKPVLQEWDETGYDRTILINALIVKYGEACKKELMSTLRSMGILPKRDGDSRTLRVLCPIGEF